MIQPAHNADFFDLRISKIPANAHQTHYFSALAAGDFGGVGLSKNGRYKWVDGKFACGGRRMVV